MTPPFSRTSPRRASLCVDAARPGAAPRGYYSLHMRRYLGCKTRLLAKIAEVVAAQCPRARRVIDIFAGTGVVGHLLNTPRREIVVNDFLASNAMILQAWFCAVPADRREIEEVIGALRGCEIVGPNYYSENYGGRFFSEDVARRIGALRDAIDAWNLRPIVKAAAVASVLYAADAAAVTCGHFDAFRPVDDERSERRFVLRLPDIPYRANGNNLVFCRDGNELAAEIEGDLLYVDPPYNRRQYGTLYHVLENIALNTKPALAGKTRKPPLDLRPHSEYCTNRAAEAMGDLIARCRVRHLLVSYNNMSSGVGNSNALIPLGVLEAMLAGRGAVTTHRIPFPSFTARRGLLDGHQEYLLYCRVTKPPR